MKTTIRKTTVGVFLIGCAWSALPCSVQAYIDVTPTLGRIINDSDHIVLLRVEKVDLERRVILFHKLADLKGRTSSAPVKHRITNGLHPREPATILEWAERGQSALSFQNERTAEICIGNYWYECSAAADGWWIMNCGQAQLTFAYKGSASMLTKHVRTILSGQEALITAVKYGADSSYWRACKRLIAMRDVPQGTKFPMCRFKASLKMPASIYRQYRNPEFVTEAGMAGPNDVATLVTALQDDDWTSRSEAAQLLASIDPPAKNAVPALRQALHDRHPWVRMRAAEAMTVINPSEADAVTALVDLLDAPDAKIRKEATQALGNVGEGDGTMVPRLIAA